jgi:tRNA(Ile)-lysidine synthase
MAPVSAWPFAGHDGLRLLRPLLKLSRADTHAVCEAFGVEPVEDESSASPKFRRNRVRHEVLPLLREMNPQIDASLVRLAENARENVDYVEDAARALIDAPSGTPSPKSEIGQGVRLPLTLSQAPPAIRHSAIRLALTSFAGDTHEFTQRHYDAVEGLLLSGVTGDRVVLPREVVAVVDRDEVVFRQGGDPLPNPLPEGEGTRLDAEGARSHFGQLVVSLCQSQPPSGNWVEVNAQAVDGGVCVRRRRDGDRFQPLGMRGAKKLQDFFVDARVPREERDRVPIFESARGIVWVGGLRIAEWAKPRPGEPTLFLCFEPVTD